MFFKNARFYRLLDAWALSAAELSEKLAEFQFHECGALDSLSYGFVSPDGGCDLAHETAAGGAIMVCAKRQEKLLPAAVIKEELNKRVAQIRDAECRPVGRKERDTLKDEVVFSLLPKAFVKSSLEFAYIDTKAGWLVVNTASAKRAEDLICKLREALGGLRCVPVGTVSNPVEVLTGWVQNDCPPPFGLGDSAVLDAQKDGRGASLKSVDLSAGEVLSLIESGMAVNRLSVVWRESVTFSVDEGLTLRGLKFGDDITARANDKNPETRAQQFAADFSVMVFELGALLGDLVNAMGGVLRD